MNNSNIIIKSVRAFAEGLKFGAHIGLKGVKELFANYTAIMVLGTIGQIAILAYSILIWQTYNNIWYGLADWMVGGTLVNIVVSIIANHEISRDSAKRDQYVNDIVNAATAA